MSFDPRDRFPGWPSMRSRPRVVRTGPMFGRGRRIVAAVAIAAIVVVVVAASLMGLRVQMLFYDSTGHSNVFWTPVLAKLVLFLVGLVAAGGLMALNIPLWRAAARTLDKDGPRIALWTGLGLSALVGVISGAYLAGQWQDVLLWIHGHSFGQQDPVFHTDFSFFVYTLPVADHLQAIGWGVAVVSLLAAGGLAAACLSVQLTPEEVPLPLRPPAGTNVRDGVRIATLHAGIALVAIFVLAALGAHYGVYHLGTSSHDGYVGLDATERTVVRPVLGALQFVALAFVALTVAVLVRRRGAEGPVTGIVLGSLLGGWLLVAGLSQGIPAAIYQAASVNPNAATAQSPTIRDFIATSRVAWALQPGTDVDSRSFGTPTPLSPPDLTADPGTLANVRIQDPRQLPETMAQIDRSISYVTYPRVTVDRYPLPGGGETEVMLSPREIAEADIPNSTFVNQAFVYTHGYGITAVSVNSVVNEGKPDLLAGREPLQQVSPSAPPDLSFSGGGPAGDPRIYCGLATTQPVVVNTGTGNGEFDYPSGSGDHNSRYGNAPGGFPVPGGFDRLAVSVSAFGGLDLLLTNQLGPDSRVFLHRQIQDRVQTLAPFLRLDGDPYVVTDPGTGHLVFIQDAYIATDRVPESFQLDDGTSYMRNAVKAVVDARTCQTTLYAVDMSEPLTASYDEIFPNLLTPLERMPMSLRSHLRYPEDLLRAQSQAYAFVHINDPLVLFNRSDVYRLADEDVNGSTQPTQASYVELTLPGETHPEFVLLQDFSPFQGSGSSSNVLKALLAARSDYTTTGHPKLVAIPIDPAANVLGPLQFDNNLNTDKTISSEITLLSQSGSKVQLGNVIVLPFNGHSFLYVRPLYVQASNGSFPALQDVLVGTQTAVAKGASLADALHNLFGADVPGLPSSLSGQPSPTPSPSPGPSASPGPSPSGGVTVTSLVQDLLEHQTLADAAYRRGDYAEYGRQLDAVRHDEDELRTLVGSGTPSASPG